MPVSANPQRSPVPQAQVQASPQSIPDVTPTAKPNYVFDWDLIGVGGGYKELRFDVLPLRWLWAKPGVGLVIHPLVADWRGTATMWAVATTVTAAGDSGPDKYALLNLEPFQVELRQRLWQVGGRASNPRWPPFYGDGISMSAYASAAPLSQGVPFGSQTGDAASNVFSVFSQLPVADSYDYAVGVRFDSGYGSLCLGYSWMHSDSFNWTNPRGIPYSFPAMDWSGPIARIELLPAQLWQLAGTAGN
jgi:hypothetical protein